MSVQARIKSLLLQAQGLSPHSNKFIAIQIFLPHNLPNRHFLPNTGRPFVPKPSPPASQGPSSVGCLTKQGDVSVTDVHSKLTSATGVTAEASMLGPFVPSCRDSNKTFNSLFVPLPNRITTPVNVNNLSKELEWFVGSMDRESSQQLQMWFSEHFSRQNLLRSLSSLLFLLQWNKNGAKKCLKNHIPFDF